MKSYLDQGGFANMWQGRDEGFARGLAVARARSVLFVLRARGIAVADAARDRILAEKEGPRRERWLERAVVASSVAEVLEQATCGAIAGVRLQ
jgi:hypothetical protein